MTRDRIRTAAAIASCLAAAAAAPSANGADWVIGPANVDPPFGPPAAVGASYTSLVDAWGTPSAPLEDVPVAVWPRGLEVTFSRGAVDRAIKFWAGDRRWRTPRGARVGMTVARLRQIYGAALIGVPDARGILGVRTHYMVRSGRHAVGFVMRPRGVTAIISGRHATVRSDLRFAGPL